MVLFFCFPVATRIRNRLFFLAGIIVLLAVGCTKSERICERQGSCKKCDSQARYSYYTCTSDPECFSEESCIDGFCCPRVNSTKFVDTEHRPFTSSFFDESSLSSASCPDGSSWMRMCKTDLDCLFADEICALGKCCTACSAKRRSLIREHPPHLLIGLQVPECSDDGRFYRLKQCVFGFRNECFCVTLYGERVQSTFNSQGQLICSLSESQGDNNHVARAVVPAQTAQGQPPTVPANTYFVGNNGAYQEATTPRQVCNDPRKEFRPCMSACFVACDTRTRPTCPHAEQCHPGCQCQVPYILENSNDSDSRCMLPADCPLPNSPTVPTTGRVYYRPATVPLTAEASVDQSFLYPSSERPKVMHCVDPLKNFLMCGSSCPPACGRLTPVCSFQCIAGCFCRTPYVLSNLNNANSACILPHHCGIQGFIPNPTPVPAQTTPTPPFDLTPESSTTPTAESPLTTNFTVTCSDPNKEFLSCASSCPMACDNLEPPLCSPCVSGCFCRNGFVFRAGSNWTDSDCVRITACPTPPMNSTDDQDTTTPVASSNDDGPNSTASSQGGEAVGASMFTIYQRREIGKFVFSTSVEQKIRFDAYISYLPPSQTRTYVAVLHKYGALPTDVECLSIGDVLEINPVYTYPFPNGTLLYLRDVKVPYRTSYMFEASSEFAARSVGAVIGRSIALHELMHATGNGTESELGPPLGCATVSILQNR